MTNTISPFWTGIAVVVPMLAGLAVAWPFWRKVTRDPVGILAGSFVVFGSAIALVARELVSLQAFTSRCVQLEIACQYRPEPFTRFFLYGSIALVQVFTLFVVGWRIESRLRERDVAPQWRR